MDRTSRILQDLYDSEINFTIAAFWNGGFQINLGLGDEVNGFDAEGEADNIVDAVEWLRVEAIEKYPESVLQKLIDDDLTCSAGATTTMVVYCAHNCDTEFETEVEELECGAGQIVCLECDGSGRCLFPPEMVGGELACVDCKGTGRQLVSI